MFMKQQNRPHTSVVVAGSIKNDQALIWKPNHNASFMLSRFFFNNIVVVIYLHFLKFMVIN